MNLSIIGAGSWGTALALIAARNQHQVTLWARSAGTVRAIETKQESPALPAIILPDNIIATNSLEAALQQAEIVVIAVPSHIFRLMLERLKELWQVETILISATKGIENETLLRMSQIISEVLGEVKTTILSGPNFAAELARNEPAASVIASTNLALAEQIQQALSTNTFRLYTNSDVIGVEYGGAVKNVIAIATGIVTGLGYGYNAAAAVVTRGLAEITRLALAQGGRIETMMGLAGVGDLTLTCFGALSRNRRVGVELGRGRKLDDIISEMRQVAEGVKTTKSTYDLARKLSVEMPITEIVYEVLNGSLTAKAAAGQLMGRPLKGEG